MNALFNRVRNFFRSLVVEIDDDHPEALSRLDRENGVGERTS